ncbi:MULTISPECIES: Fe(3+) ABC transporter substrate-binding protein [Malaciobacter]|jgi:iron(III) transport system substrate-binding protein|uniref:Iron(III) transport system substrate-binding protein n=2 Tax=Malaciobacter TaxID=2321114 RepID=A0AB36ZYM5_9BACT|nr:MULTISPECIES: Fe(3+) ABC transporter substrate-binding protein [Malaciobacter]PHO10652.1 Fe(3+) ABC transporter substrate-binding protein [Malaciobacter canalis]PHO13780.1 Fe(3+) ABC transporter substrate-binding protein [Malaciobacter marinus]PPK61613.1 iron(III) transport system substrate-binding protein [Malaciobacter marinus]QEE33805.1 iron(III)/spermidine/putrescine ABC transporter, periplasmic substrate-binding protein [Malaciobacter canalis]RYA24258.1 Fe(3+) ABC transporter substrate
MLKKLALSTAILVSSVFASSEVNVYSHRHYDTDKKLFKMFEEKTGIKVNVIKAKASALIKRIESEGKKSPADVLITVDAGRLYQAKSKNLLQSIKSNYLMENIPKQLRDVDNQWFALTKRARVTAYKIGSGMDKKLTTYEDLADPKFKGQIMVRSSNNIYNQSLMAAMIAHHGEEYAIKWAKGVVANMAKAPKGNDRYQVKAIASGIGSIAIVNTYYIGKMVDNKDLSQSESVKKVKVFFPKFENGGTHINVSGAGVAKYAPNKENAIKFIEFLASKDAQELFSKANFEYPVLKSVEASDLVKSWGTFEDDHISINTLGQNNKAAVKAFDLAGWK